MKSSKDDQNKALAATLKAVAKKVGLATGTISAVLNESPSSKKIPLHTKKRILAAARELNYRPNFFARSLRKKRTFTVGILAHEIGDPYSSMVIAAIENFLRQRDYFFLIGIHRHDPRLLEKYSSLLLERGVEGFITVDLNLPHSLPLPTVAVAGHAPFEGVTNIVLDHRQAALIALRHLYGLGHRKIAFMKGHPSSADSASRWQAIREVTRELGIDVDPSLVAQVQHEESSPELGYPCAQRVLAAGKPFTAFFAYDDVTAIGVIRALTEAGLRVPDDVSVVGFDDIPGAAFHNPSLTTVRQPLQKMGGIAAETILRRIESDENCPTEIAIEPELVVRESTAKARMKIED